MTGANDGRTSSATAEIIGLKLFFNLILKLKIKKTRFLYIINHKLQNQERQWRIAPTVKISKLEKILILIFYDIRTKLDCRYLQHFNVQ